jgi:hypothetical protein
LRGPALERCYRLILDADLELKSSSGRAPRTVVEELVVRLGSPELAPAGR